MKYNIIGDIHGRPDWIHLVKEDAINIFVGDYFSPYDHKITFEDCKRNFLDIIEYKKKHWDNTILLIGNHDEDHWHICEYYSRHDREHEDEIRNLFEMHKGLFQVAYSIENKALVTHAGVSYVWYDRYKNHTWAHEAHNCNYDDPDEIKNPFTYKAEPYPNPMKFSLCKSPEEAYNEWINKAYKDWAEENKKPKDGEFILWNDSLWRYNKAIDKFEKYAPEPDEIAEFINKLWKEDEKYSAFNFDSHHGPYDSYGDSVTHGPMWIRPEALRASNIFVCRDIWQFFGHTQNLYYTDALELSDNKILMLTVYKKDHLVCTDCQSHGAISFLYDSETGEINLNRVER